MSGVGADSVAPDYWELAMTKRWMAIIAVAVVLVGGGLAIAALTGGDDEPDDPYAEVQAQLAPPEPNGPLLETRTEVFADVPNPCDGSMISVDLEESVYGHGDESEGTVLIINRSEVTTPTGFAGTGSFWLIVPEDGPPIDSGYFESGVNAETGQRYVRYGDGPFPDFLPGSEYTEECVGDDA